MDVEAGSVNLTNDTVESNTAQGGLGGAGTGQGFGGSAWGGAMDVEAGSVNLTNDTVESNTAQGGKTAASNTQSGSAYGGAIATGDFAITVTLCNDTVEFNSAVGGPAGPGVSAGNGYGGGLYIESGNPAFGNPTTVYMDTSTQANIINNTASTSDPNIDGSYIVQNC
jgi:hypothetical protein